MFKELTSIGKKVKREILFYKNVISDKRTPRVSKILISVAIGYAVMPFDIIPDFIPVIGQLDDVIIVSVLIIIARKFIPKEVFTDARKLINDSN